MGGHLQSDFFLSKIEKSKIKKKYVFFKKVALSSNASDYQEKLYGTRREAEKTKKLFSAVPVSTLICRRAEIHAPVP